MRQHFFLLCCVFVPCLIGCGLFESKKPYTFQETPQYYQSERDGMIDEMKMHRQSQISRLDNEAKELEAERKRNDEIAAEKAAKKKKSVWANWFGKGDETFMMSGEAKKINENLQR